MDEKNICFIVVVNNEDTFNECKLYIDSLEVPNGFTTNIITIKNIENLCKAYNIAMRSSNAKYKVYIHEDVLIINKKFIYNLINTFKNDDTLGLLGVCGAKKLPDNAIWWESEKLLGQVYDCSTGRTRLLSFGEVENLYEEVETVDGLIMITQHDIKWREDLFDKGYFYDIAQCTEFISKGYKVSVVKQEKPWCIHDCVKEAGPNEFEKYRNIYLNDYKNTLKKKKITFYYSNLVNEFFTRDLCVIPYVLQKYYGYEAVFTAPIKEQEFPDNEKYLGNMRVVCDETMEKIMDELKDTDILMLLGIYEFNVDLIYKFKDINPEGKIYLKLDANIYWMHRIINNMDKITLEALQKCTLITAEDRRCQELLNRLLGLDVKLITNGYYDFVNNNKINYKDKSNVILFAGRIGIREKANHLLFEAFKNISDKIPNWNLEFAGNIDESFKPYVDGFLKENEDLKDRIVFTGWCNKEKLKERYENAKVFCLTSVVEGCPNVLSEAVSNGCYIVASDVGGVIDVTDGGNYGSIFAINNLSELQNCLLEACSNEGLLDENCNNAQEYAREKLHWVKLCGKIDNWLK